jgi:hypothetical protein
MDIKTLAKSNQRVNLSVLDAERGVASWATLNCNRRETRTVRPSSSFFDGDSSKWQWLKTISKEATAAAAAVDEEDSCVEWITGSCTFQRRKTKSR